MVSVTLEGLWIVSDTIVDSRFFIKFHKSGSAIIFNFWTITENVSYPSKKLLIKQKTSSIWWLFFWKDCGWFLMNCRFSIFRQNSQVRTCINFQLFNYHGACELSIKKAPNQEKDLIKKVNVTLEWLRMVSDRIVDFLFFVKFHKSGPAIIFSFWTVTEHDCYPSIKLVTKKRLHQDGECYSWRIMDGFW